MTTRMFFVKLLLIASLLQEFQFQLISYEDRCTSDETLAIKQQKLDILDEQMKNLNSLNEQQLVKVRERLLESLLSSPALIIQSEIDTLVESLGSSECASQLRAKANTENSSISFQQDKCVAKSKKKETSLTNKTNSFLKKFEFDIRKADFALQKCGLKNSYGECSIVESCSQLVVLELMEKIESAKYKFNSSIEKLVLEQNNCFEKVSNKAIAVKALIEKEVLECRLQEVGTTQVNEVTETDQSSESTKLDEYTEASFSESTEQFSASKVSDSSDFPSTNQPYESTESVTTKTSTVKVSNTAAVVTEDSSASLNQTETTTQTNLSRESLNDIEVITEGTDPKTGKAVSNDNEHFSSTENSDVEPTKQIENNSQDDNCLKSSQ